MALFRGRSGERHDGGVAAPTVNGNGSVEPSRRVDTARYDLKARVHRQLIERLDLAKLSSLPGEVVQQQIRRIVEDMLVADETPLSRQEREDLVREIQDETFGLGPIEPLMQDPTVADILVRAVANRPIPGVVELVELALACSFFLALPAVFLRDGHIVVDVVVGMAPRRAPLL